jgi:hypothetical protein
VAATVASCTRPVGKQYGPGARRKVLVLVISFPGARGCGAGGGSGYGLECVVGGVGGVGCHVGCGGSVTGRAGCSASRAITGVAGGGVGGYRGGASLADPPPAARPGTPHLDGVPGPVVSRVPLLEEREYALGAVGGPEHQRPVIVLVELHPRGFVGPPVGAPGEELVGRPRWTAAGAG